MRKMMFWAVASLLTASAALTPAQADNFLYPAPHRYRPPYTYKHSGLPRGWRWVEIPGSSYAPIHPQDYSIPTGEYWARLQEPYPYCCPFPLYSPEFRPEFRP